MKKSFKLLVGFLFGMAFFLPAVFVFAAVDTGVDQVGATIALSDTSPIVMAVKIINFALMFLGIIAVSLVIYGGFVWMTSNGNEDRIATAKKILKNALIGLIIILSAWGIAAFILRRLTGSGSGSGSGVDTTGGQNYQVGLGAVGACVVENFFPSAEKSNVPRNSSIMVTFKEEVAPESICKNDSGNACACSTACNKLNPEAIQIFKKEAGNACGASGCNTNNTNLTKATVGLSYDKKTIVILPQEYLGEANVAVPYGVRFTNQIKNLRGENIFSKCQPNYLEWNFSVNGLIDLVPPIVVSQGVFPPVDNQQDSFAQRVGSSAIAKIEIVRAMGPEKEASFTSTPGGNSSSLDSSSFVMSNNYQEISNDPGDVFEVSVDSGNVFVISAGGKSRGAAQPVKQGNEYLVSFPNFFSFKIDKVVAGNSWKIKLNKPYPADILTVGGRNLSINQAGTLAETVSKVKAFLENPAVFNEFKDVAISGNVLTIIAKPGAQGNDISLSSARSGTFKITPFSGGADGGKTLNPGGGKPDQPMNSAIQINFSKEINPLTIAGPSNFVSSTIRVININDGQPVTGNFTLSSDYKTLEFLSDNQCGVNGCGEKIYCLPANSNLKVELIAADLENCSDNTACGTKAPFSNCNNLSALSHKSCANSAGKFYPAANVLSLKGIFDASSNSFDGNRDTFSDGPVDIFNENVGDKNKKDNFQWSFFISDQMETTAPIIRTISPENNVSGADLNVPITIEFSRLMLNASLVTGSKIINNGKGDVEHKFLNIRSFGNPAGYWVSSFNKSAGDNGVLDQTTIKINHSVFSESSAFNAQAGSGIRDIYQNCFKPSGSDSCPASAVSPSCCFDVPVSNATGLDADGNCK